MTSTFRADARRNMLGLMTAYNTATAALSHVYPTRPGDFNDVPCLYIGGITEPRILHDSGIRQRDIEMPTVLVDGLFDSDETADRLDALVDGWLDYLTANEHGIPGALLQPVRSQDVELAMNGTSYAAVIVTVKVEIQEPR